MARMNTAPQSKKAFTHEGGKAFAHMTPEQALRRSVMSCLLWEKEFYEDGVSIADRIRKLCSDVSPETVAALAIEARNSGNLRHVPLLLLESLTRTAQGTDLVSRTIPNVIQRADEMAEFLSIYWSGGDRKSSKPKHGKTVTHQVRKGLAMAMRQFDEYQLAKYDRDGKVKLRDVFRIVRPVPDGETQKALWGRAVKRELAIPDTWETELSAGKDKKEVFERLLNEKKLGYLALLRNLRNMTQAGVDLNLIRAALKERRGAHRVLPFRYVAAARVVPQLEPELDAALVHVIKDSLVLPGVTAVLVDVSGSMDAKLSGKSDLMRHDAAAILASMINGNVRMFSFSNALVEVPPRRGMAGVDAILSSQEHGGTRLFDAVAEANAKVDYDRIIVITDEQAHAGYHRSFYQQNPYQTGLPDPKTRGYMINVASAQNGVGYGKWIHIDGFSENVLRYIYECEAQGLQ